MMSEKEKKLEDIAAEASAIKCSVSRAKHFVLQFLAGPMCGKCYPCSFGSYEARLRLKEIVSGSGTQEDLDALDTIARHMLSMSMCKKGKDTARFIMECMSQPDFGAHITKGVCREKHCTAFIEYRNVPANCIRCGACKDACRYDAIHGEKQVSMKCCFLPFEIRQKRCTKCGECIKVCPSKAIIVVDVETEKTDNKSVKV